MTRFTTFVSFQYFVILTPIRNDTNKDWIFFLEFVVKLISGLNAFKTNECVFTDYDSKNVRQISELAGISDISAEIYHHIKLLKIGKIW